MPTYNTPDPIDIAVNLQAGTLSLTASSRADTVVTVSPSNPSRESDRRGADETRVSFDGQRLTVIAPKPQISIFGPNESIDVTIEVPAGSRLTAELAAGTLRTTGELGATRIKSMTGPVDVDKTGDLWLRAGHGNATIGTADGDLEVTADHGQIRVGEVTGHATLKSSHGTVLIGRAGGAIDAKLSYGDLDVTEVHGSVTAKTAYGSILLRSVEGGSIEVDSGFGQVAVGVRDGLPAWLDLAAKNGNVRNELVADATPAVGASSVAVRARTQFGDIDIRRAG